MYIREIPEQYRSEAKQIMIKNNTVLLMPREDLERLFYFYYRYIKVLRRGEKVEPMIKKDLGCIACRGKVIMYFKNNFQEW
jgi:hypothetical protein